jgi:hypothetical protein
MPRYGAAPLNFGAMPPHKNTRRLAAISFALPAMFSLGIAAILWSNSGPAPMELSLELCGIALVSTFIAALLLSPAALSKSFRLSLLIFLVAASLVTVSVVGKVLMLGWIWPLWFVFRYYRDSDLSITHILSE